MRRWLGFSLLISVYNNNNNNNKTIKRWITGEDNTGDSSAFLSEDEALRGELASALATEIHTTPLDILQPPLGQGFSNEAMMGTDNNNNNNSVIHLEKLARPPARFDLLTNSFVYRWQTKAAFARKVCGPMREWAAELKYRTGVHIELEPTFPERLSLETTTWATNNTNHNITNNDTTSNIGETETSHTTTTTTTSSSNNNNSTTDDVEGPYESADDVDITVYLFGSERGIFNCHKLMEAAIQQDPVYVRLGIFRRISNTNEVEWLLLRRINRELRPPDIPPISLKLPGKWTLLYERYKEAAIRTCYEETGITIDPMHIFPTAQLYQTLPQYYWRVPVRYFIAEVPYDIKVEGPQVVPQQYMRNWEIKLLKQSPDPIDRAWAELADPNTGCAWMKSKLIDELQKPLRGENYMAIRYTPPPYSNLQEIVGLGDGVEIRNE